MSKADAAVMIFLLIFHAFGLWWVLHHHEQGDGVIKFSRCAGVRMRGCM